MTSLGRYLSKKNANKATISQSTGISSTRLTLLTLNHSSKLRADELYLIAMAIDVEPGDMIMEVFKDLKLR